MNLDVHFKGQFIRKFEVDFIVKDDISGDTLCYKTIKCTGRVLIASIPKDHFVLITNPE